MLHLLAQIQLPEELHVIAALEEVRSLGMCVGLAAIHFVGHAIKKSRKADAANEEDPNE